jgi:hypothetical protein
LYSEPTLHAQGCGFACFEKLRKRLHAVSSHENSSVADVDEDAASLVDQGENPDYSQGLDRRELFERQRGFRGV